MTKRVRSLYRVGVLLIFAAGFLVPAAALANPAPTGTTSWVPTGTGGWDDAGNWNNGLPTLVTDAYITNSGTAILLDGQTGTTANLWIGSSGTGVTPIVPSGSGTRPDLPSGLGLGNLIINGGYLYSGLDVVVGTNPGDYGVVDVAGGTFTYTQLLLGYEGTGVMHISGGYVSDYGSFDVLGDWQGSVGTMIVSGGTWSNPNGLYVGDQGEGILDVTGGYVTMGNLLVGVNTGAADSTVLLTGGTTNVSQEVIIGNSGTGTITISNAGSLIISGGSGTMYLGQYAGSQGTLNISGTGANMLEAADVTGVIAGAMVNFDQDGSYTASFKLSGLLSVNQGGDGGTTVMAQAESYTGNTTVSAGTLLLSGAGDISKSPVIDVMQGATLDVSGVTGGSWTVAASQTLGGNGLVNAGTVIVVGTLSPGLGQSTGGQNLTVSGNLNLGGSTSLTIYSGGGNDLVTDSDGLLSYGGTLAVNLSGLLADGSYVFTLFSATRATGDFSPGGVTVDGTTLSETSANTWTGSFTDNGTTYDATFTDPSNSDGVLSVSAVPEPAVWGLLGVAMAAGILFKAKRPSASPLK